jgi:hypothetical protein
VILIKWFIIVFVIVLYSVALFLPLSDFMLLIKYKMPIGCDLSNDMNRVSDNIFVIAFGGYYFSVMIIIIVMRSFNCKRVKLKV